MSYTYTTDLAAIRAVVHRYAIQAGLTEARAIDLTLAVSEVAANTIKHAKVNQVCDQVELQSDENGTTIRLHMTLPRRGTGQ